MSTYSQNIYNAIKFKLDSDDKFLVIGQGLWSPWYVGNTMMNLEKDFGKNRVIDTPVSEAATTGLALGYSLNNTRVLVLHPRMDFSLLAFDQIINQISNWELMFGGQSIPNITLRLVINRGGEQGAQHSQALHSVLSHFPGLKIVIPSSPEDAGKLLIAAIDYNGPSVYIDDRWLYEESSINQINFVKTQKLYQIKPKLVNKGDEITLVSFGFGINISKNVITLLSKNKRINCDLIDLRIINPLNYDKTIRSLNKTKKLVFIDIGYKNSGIGATFISELKQIVKFNFKVLNFGIYDTPAPANKKLEKEFYHSHKKIYKKICKTFCL